MIILMKNVEMPMKDLFWKIIQCQELNCVKSIEFLKFSKHQKLNIIYLAKQKKHNIKLVIIEKEGIPENEANQIAYKLGWQRGKLIR